MPRQTSDELACPWELSNSPCLYLTAESDSAEFTSDPDGSNARTIRQIRQVRIWRVTGNPMCVARAAFALDQEACATTQALKAGGVQGVCGFNAARSAVRALR